jgi:hypothetical protein
MEERKRLSIVIEHWIEHNQSHMGEYRKWAQRAGELGLEMVQAEIEEAIERLSQCNTYLEKALEGVSSSEELKGLGMKGPLKIV